VKFTEDIRLRGASLLHQQCWQWGCDIRRENGNLLLEYGFERERPPENACSRYSMNLGKRRVVVLWGFGFFTGRSLRSGVYLNRYEFCPRLVNVEGAVFAPEALCGGAPVRGRRAELALLAGAFRWMARYEEWIAAHEGVEYRRTGLRSWGQPFVDPVELPACWRSLATDLQS